MYNTLLTVFRVKIRTIKNNINQITTQAIYFHLSDNGG